jgi:hypothetical protein
MINMQLHTHIHTHTHTYTHIHTHIHTHIQTHTLQMYWTLFARFSEGIVSKSTSDDTLVAIKRLHHSIDRRLRRLPRYARLYAPLYHDALVSTIGNIFRRAYPLWFASQFGYSSAEHICAVVDELCDVSSAFVCCFFVFVLLFAKSVWTLERRSHLCRRRRVM